MDLLDKFSQVPKNVSHPGLFCLTSASKVQDPLQVTLTLAVIMIALSMPTEYT